MNDVDTGYLVELSFLAASSIDVQFQAWMAISFAVIVASYSGRTSLTNSIRGLVAVVYFLAAYSLFARWMTEADRLGQIHAVLVARNVHISPIMYSAEARLITYALGTLMTVFSISYFGKGGTAVLAPEHSAENDA
jgi:hypothetical protein